MIFLKIIKGLSTKEWRTKRVQKTEKKSAKVETFRIYQEDIDPEASVDGVVILDWWGKKEAPPYLKRLTDDCGGCFLTNDQRRGNYFSKTLNPILEFQKQAILKLVAENF